MWGGCLCKMFGAKERKRKKWLILIKKTKKKVEKEKKRIKPKGYKRKE